MQQKNSTRLYYKTFARTIHEKNNALLCYIVLGARHE
jgi:hypothetical protein